jgi:hypothetical protein
VVLGEVGYRLTSAGLRSLVYANRALNEAFISADGAADHEVAVEVTTADLPPVGGRVLFDTEVAWRLRRAGEQYGLSLRLDGVDSAVMTFDRRISSVRLRSPAIAEPAGDVAINPFCYPVDQVLTVYALAERHGVLVHAAGLERDGRVILFPGVSGAGKSTISRLLAGRNGWTLLSDDRVILRRRDDGWRAYGTPWPGEAGFAAPRCAPLAGIYFLRKADEHRTARLTPSAALRAVMPVASIPWFDAEVFPSVLDTCGELTRELPAGELFFRRDPGVAGVVDALA